MMKYLIPLLSLLLFITTSSFSLMNVEGGGFPATAPDGSNYSLTLGYAGGVSIDATRLFEGTLLQIRADVSSYNWNEGSNEFSRIPIFLGGRLMFRFSGIPKWISLYAETGLELSIEKAIIDRVQTNSFLIGITPGIGSEFYLLNNLYVSPNLRYHVIDNTGVTGGGSYFTLGGLFGLRF